jgi:mannose/fructose-specific phosphotransferase system component IIA
MKRVLLTVGVIVLTVYVGGSVALAAVSFVVSHNPFVLP